jgi:hypothetical protein
LLPIVLGLLPAVNELLSEQLKLHAASFVVSQVDELQLIEQLLQKGQFVGGFLRSGLIWLRSVLAQWPDLFDCIFHKRGFFLLILLKQGH